MIAAMEFLSSSRLEQDVHGSGSSISSIDVLFSVIVLSPYIKLKGVAFSSLARIVSIRPDVVDDVWNLVEKWELLPTLQNSSGNLMLSIDRDHQAIDLTG